MSWYRWLLCCLCLVVADGAWLYPLLGLMGFVAGLGHAPVSLAALEGVLVLAAATTALAGILPPAWRAAHVLPIVFAAIGVWLGVWSCADRVGVEADLAWPFELLAMRHSRSDVAALITVVVILGWCWHHAARRARNGAGAPTIARGFRAGMVVLVTVLAFEAAGRLDLGTRAALAPFFAASLLGLALARAPAHGSLTRAWLVLTVGVVAVVLVAGTVLGVGLVVAVRGGLGALWSLWLQLATAATESLGDTLHALLGDADAGTAASFRPDSVDAPDWFVMAVLLAGAALMGALAHRLLTSPRRELPQVVLDLGEAERESLESRDTRNVGRWVEAMMPWRRRDASVDRDAATSGIARIHLLYAQLLDLARRRGIPFNAAHTPYERAAVLRRDLPRAPVDDVTRGLVHARYGGEAPSPETLARLTQALTRSRHG